MARAATARLFVALDLPAPVRDALVAWRAPLLAGRDDLRAVPVAALHVTVAFLGALPVASIPALSAALTACAGPADGLALGAPLWLPRRRPRALCVGVEDGDGSLGRLQARVADTLAEGGWYAPPERPYLPHVTVARVRGRAPLAARGVAGAATPPAAPRPFAGAALVLYRSHLGGAGARYEPLVRVPS